MSKNIKPHKLAANFLVLSGGEAISKTLSFLSFTYLARVLGPDTFGFIEFALAVTLFFNIVADGGFHLFGAREIAKDEKNAGNLVFHIVIIRCFLAISAFLLLLLFVAVTNKSSQEKQLLMLYGLTLFGTPGLLLYLFQGLERMHWVAISSVIRWSLFAGAVFFYISEPSQVWIVPLIELTAIIFVVIFNFCIFRYFFGRLWRQIDISFSLSILWQALPICLTDITEALKYYLPIIMLGFMVGAKEVGFFGSVQRIIFSLCGLTYIYYFNIYPSIVRCTGQTLGTLQRLIGKSLQVTSWTAVFIGTVGTSLAESLINLVYGPQYDEATVVFQVLIWLVVFTIIGEHFNYILIGFGKQYLRLISMACGACVCIILNLLLIPRCGLLGAAWSLLCTEVVVCGLAYYFVCREIAIIPFWRHMTRPLIVGAIIAIVLSLLPNLNFILAGGIAVLLYGLGLLALQPNIIYDVRTLLVNSRQKL